LHTDIRCMIAESCFKPSAYFLFLFFLLTYSILSHFPSFFDKQKYCSKRHTVFT
jgi:hypothetical protein